jgi:hypothetical protein
VVEWVVGVDLFVVNQGLRIFDPSCIRLNPLKVNNLSKESMALSSIVQSFFESWGQWKSGIGIYKSLMHNALRILELGPVIASNLHLTP